MATINRKSLKSGRISYNIRFVLKDGARQTLALGSDYSAEFVEEIKNKVSKMESAIASFVYTG